MEVSWRTARGQALAGAGVLLALAAALRIFPPDNFPFYPGCLFHQWTGLACPGCGMTHALAALLAGRVLEAVHDNLLAVLLTPAALAVAIGQAYTAVRWNRWRPMVPSPRAAAIVAAAALLFGAVRNIAPHLLGTL